MLPSGLPELSSLEDIQYVSQALLPGVSVQQASSRFTRWVNTPVSLQVGDKWGRMTDIKLWIGEVVFCMWVQVVLRLYLCLVTASSLLCDIDLLGGVFCFVLVFLYLLNFASWVIRFCFSMFMCLISLVNDIRCTNDAILTNITVSQYHHTPASTSFPLVLLPLPISLLFLLLTSLCILLLHFPMHPPLFPPPSHSVSNSLHHLLLAFPSQYHSVPSLG